MDKMVLFIFMIFLSGSLLSAESYQYYPFDKTVREQANSAKGLKDSGNVYLRCKAIVAIMSEAFKEDGKEEDAEVLDDAVQRMDNAAQNLYLTNKLSGSEFYDVAFTKEIEEEALNEVNKAIQSDYDYYYKTYIRTLEKTMDLLFQGVKLNAEEKAMGNEDFRVVSVRPITPSLA